VRGLFWERFRFGNEVERWRPGLTNASGRRILYVLDLNPNPSNLEGFGTPASLSRVWTRHRCRAEGLATRPDRKYRDLRIENTLTDEHGDDVKLKKGGHVEVTVTSKK
jgi:hypothetical protein